MQLKITNDNYAMIGEFNNLLTKGIVISNGEKIYMLNIPIDSARSKGFYIQADTLFFGNNWIGTISNGNEVYLSSGAGQWLNMYQPPHKEKQDVMLQPQRISVDRPISLAQYSAKERAAHIALSMFPNASSQALNSAPHLLCLLGKLIDKNSPKSERFTDEESVSDLSNVSCTPCHTGCK